MNKTLQFLLFCLATCLFIHAVPKKKIPRCTNSYRIAPPGTVQIEDNLFADELEITNIAYQEYLYWLERIKGKKSTSYQAALPDTLVWVNFDLDPYMRYYLWHPAYQNYPLVGVTYDQVQTYSKWRSDRVYEMILTQANIINYQNQEETNYFTTERYLAGQYFNYVPDSNILVPTYRLPTEAEWEMLAAGGMTLNEHAAAYGIDTKLKSLQKALKNTLHLFNTRELLNQELVAQNFIATPISSDKTERESLRLATLPNKYNILDAIGNVAEMTATEGIAKGGSWFHYLPDAAIQKHITYTEPTAWLGFRNVCSWECP